MSLPKNIEALIRPADSYAGIGSRQTPPAILALMTLIANRLEQRGMILRSGDADGADTAFQRGAHVAKLVFVPWPSFGRTPGRISLQSSPVEQKALEMAARFHPAWEKCSRAVRLLHARNCQQILGHNLDDPCTFVLCWTPEASGSGGTGQAIKIARAHNVPVFDLADDALRNHVANALDIAETTEDLLKSAPAAPVKKSAAAQMAAFD